MRKFVFSFLRKIMLVLIVIWAGLSTYLLNKEVGLKTVFNNIRILNFSDKEDSIDVAEDLKFIENTVYQYYTINKYTEVDQKINFVKERFSENIVADISQRIGDSTLHYLNSKGEQTVNINNIIFENKWNGIYKVEMNIEQRISNNKTSTFKVLLSVSLSKRGKKVITDWREDAGSPIALDSKSAIGIALGQPSRIRLPCKVLNVQPLDKQNSLAYKVSSESDVVEFMLAKNMEKTPIRFRIGCEKNRFDIALEQNSERFVVFSSLFEKEGVAISRKLSPQEKMSLSIRKQLIEMGMVVE